jgi:hypothetical protein
MPHSKISETMTLGLFVGVLLASAGLTGCGGGGEEGALLTRFFTASRLGDRTTSGNIAMVAFDPDEDGSVSNIDVTSVSEEQQRPLRMRELADELAQAQADEQEHASRMRAYQDENLEAIGQVIEAERAGDDVARPDQAVQVAWTTWRAEAQQRSRSVSDAQGALNDESQIAEVSAYDPSNRIDVQQYDGELLTKQVTIDTTVEMGDSSEARTMVVTLQKVVLGSGDDMIEGRWIISDIS